MLYSMTGFGWAEEHFTEKKTTYRLTCEVRSANHRYLEVFLKLPTELNYLEPILRSRIRKKVERGSLNVNLALEAESSRNTSLGFQFNEAVIERLISEVRRLQKKFPISGQLDLNMLLSFPEVLVRRTEESRPSKQRLRRAALKVLDLALAELNQMRQTEGAALHKEFCQRLSLMLRTISNIKAYVEQTLKEAPLANGAKANGNGAVRPISEELSRLKIHAQNFLRTINEPRRASVGRKLDFILTEMLRETDTLLAKFRRGPVVLWGIKLKEQIDILKEEVRNVS